MEAVGQLTGGVAHDFNNLLTVILGNLELVRDGVEGDEVLSETIERCLKASQRGAALTHRLLAFSRKQTLLPKTFDMSKLIADMADMLRRTLGETVYIRTTRKTGLWLCHADQAQSENALLNLALNARDAMADGGRLNIDTRNISLDDEIAAAQIEVEPGDYVVLIVSDTGCGIAEESLTQVFEPFFTTKQIGDGSGLGLSMVYGFAKQSGGAVTISSELDVGTTVKLYLPRATAQQMGEILNDTAPEIPLAEGESILIVEDDEGVRRLAVAMLSGLGYKVDDADSATSAFELLQRNGGYDVLLCDVVLPGAMNGPDLAAEIRRRNPAIEIVFMTGYAKKALDNYFGLDERARILLKPFNKSDLANAIRGALNDETPTAEPSSSDACRS